jgi:hypothetical protein
MIKFTLSFFVAESLTEINHLSVMEIAIVAGCPVGVSGRFRVELSSDIDQPRQDLAHLRCSRRWIVQQYFQVQDEVACFDRSRFEELRDLEQHGLVL